MIRALGLAIFQFFDFPKKLAGLETFQILIHSEDGSLIQVKSLFTEPYLDGWKLKVGIFDSDSIL